MAKKAVTKVREKTRVTILALLEEKVNIGKLLDNVTLHEATLIDAALKQPSLIMKASTARVQAFHKRTLRENNLALVESQAGQKFRNIRSEKGRREYTEPDVSARVTLTPEVIKARKLLANAYAEEELGKMLTEVFRQRSEAIKVIVNAGKVSVHAKELAYLTGNKKLGRIVRRIRNSWDREDDRDKY